MLFSIELLSFAQIESTIKCVSNPVINGIEILLTFNASKIDFYTLGLWVVSLGVLLMYPMSGAIAPKK